jgi:polysaccharide export outer membrane protein
MSKLCAAVAMVLLVPAGVAQTHGAGNAPTGSQRRPLTTQPDALYTLHTGDTVVVTFRFTPEFNDEVVIGPDGRASLKATGNLQMAGLTLPELEQKIVLGSAEKLVSPEVAVTLKDFERPHVVVAGEVQTPGKLELRKPTTAIQAIMMAGGPKEDSAMGRVIVFRRLNSEISEVHVLKLSKYDSRTREKNDMLLQPDDMILISRDNLSNLGRFVHNTNLGIYLQPLTGSPIY